MIELILGCASMALRDMLGTFLTIAETRGRAVLAGSLDALFDIAQFASIIFGTGLVIKDGITWHSATIIGAMCVTSFFGTILWTTLGRRIQQDQNVYGDK
jgi:hypothetical protein